MTKYENGDFVKVNFDIYANGKLVQTTDEKKGTKAGLKVEKYGEETIILGKAFVLKALDDAILKKDSDKLELKADEAYGKRNKELIKTFKKTVFDEQKLRAVPGVTYDFNGMYGTVRSVVEGRVLVDFNNPLAGKDIVLEYKVVEKVDKIDDKINLVMKSVLRMPEEMFKVEIKEKEVKIKVPKQLFIMKEQLEKSFEELINDYKEYKVEISELEMKK